MFDASKELGIFFESHVRLSTDLRNALGSYRDLNLQRLTDGLTALGDKRGVTFNTFVDNKNQGSYAMHTLNQCEHTDYDIDVAVIFENDDLPDDATGARKHVCDALAEKCTNFTREPEARKNAVTIWYADGYHIDFAVYRRRTNFLGDAVVEHAGGDGWTVRDPMAYTNWFNDKVSTKSPPTMLETLIGTDVTVPKHQLQRIVRFVKAFARSRSSWALPGGIIISTLVCEVYKAHPTRDDIALYDTLKALLDRLNANVHVDNPVLPSASFTASERRRKEVERLRDCLEEKLPSLGVLHRSDCTARQAFAAWDAIFWHDFWTTQKHASDRALVTMGLVIECWLSRKNEGPVFKQHRSDSTPLPKGLHLRFTAKPEGIVPPYSVRWSVRNEGHEAQDAEQLAHDSVKSANEPYWTSTAFKGRQKMICEVLKNGVTVRKAEHYVRIGTSR